MPTTQGTESKQSAATLNRPLRWGEPLSRVQTEQTQFVLPTGTVTLLLADIEGSTRLWESRADAMPEALGRHDELIDDIIGRHGGVRPTDQGEGDSFLAAFSRPSDAVACALALQLALAAEDWGETPIKLRIALHTGEVQLRDEGNYVGRAVNRCARIREMAHGGQTIMSQSTYELVCDHPPDGAVLRDLGTVRLRDLARPEHVHQLGHGDLDDEFPALRSLDALPNNLPVQLTSFVGREAEMQEVHALLEDTRVLTLTGSGGCGKTRLALQAAADVLDRFPDGVWVADLSPVTDPDLAAKAIASALRLREQQGQKLVDSIAAHVGSTRTMLVLDNCEHLVGVCAEIVDALLKACPGLTVLATSREPLGVPGETPWRVPSLSLPDASSSPRIDALTQFDAVKLFVERATKSRPNFAVTNENAPAVAQICHRLDGIPLAIELAAARVRVLTPDRIADGLDDRFKLLTGASRVAVPRQQTLQASVDWSYALLTEAEQAVFRRLAVFAGGFTLEAAERVCASDDIESYQVLDVLSNLVDKSLVVMDESTSQGRYTLLQTIREYARDRLVEVGEQTLVRDRHLGTYADFAVSTASVIFGGMDVAFSKLAAEHDNLRAALEWSREPGRDEQLVRMAGALVLFWMLRWHSDEGKRWTNEALSRTGDERTEIRARILNGLGYLELGTWNAMPVPALANEALSIYRELGDRSGEATSLQLLGTMAVYLGQHEMGRPQLLEAESISRELLDEGVEEGGGPWSGRALAHWVLAASLESLGFSYVYGRPFDPASAASVLDEAIAIARAVGAEDLARRSIWWRGWGEFMVGDYRRAGTWFEEMLVSARDGRSLTMEMWASNGLGWALLWQGAHERARDNFERGLALSKHSGEPGQAESIRLGLACLKVREGQLDEAVADFNERLEVATESQPWQRAQVLGWLASAELEAGDLKSARDHLTEAVRSRPNASDEFATWHITTAAEIELRSGEIDRAEEVCYEGLASSSEYFKGPRRCRFLRVLAEVAVARERFEDAARLTAAAELASGAIGIVPGKTEKVRQDAHRDAVREGLGPQAFEAAWAEGQRMSLDEAVAYAQRGRGERKRPTTGWKSLTPTELEVTKLVAEGLKNAEIAERMFVSKHTAESHLKHIYAKLGISSRTELALEATRRKETDA